ncbi:MAG: Sec61p translocation complex subunit [Vezdaea acicularis]|nr:MAG: Sec61p translocation complex subunit [Vezdaea acicularis]
MSDQIKEIADIPRDFLREGTQFLNRCTKPDKREFIKISQAVGVGFVVMGTIGYFVKLSWSPNTHHKQFRAVLISTAFLVHIPVNNILVGGA